MQTVERAMGILLTFTEGDGSLGVSEIARSLDLPKSAVHRILGTLIKTGFVEREEPSGRYRLGPRAIDLGMAAMGTPEVRAMALPVMQDLSRRTQETVTLSLLVGSERMYVSQVESPRTVRMTVKVGARFPLYAGASGRAILAALPEDERGAYLASTRLRALTPATITSREQLEREILRTREAGYAESAGERDPWAASVAAPVGTSRGRVLGSISVCGPKQRFGPAEFETYGRQVAEAAATLSRRIS
jgi:IclR family transcriptional regulator, acetate operon repressor